MFIGPKIDLTDTPSTAFGATTFIFLWIIPPKSESSPAKRTSQLV